jgi:hypothetical protein
MSPLSSIPALRACEELHVLHPNVFTRKFGLTHVCGLAVPAGASLSDIELAELFTDHGLDRICMPAHEPGLARFPLGDIDLLVFAYDGSPLEMNERIRVPQWTLGFVLSTMEPVQVTHEEAAALGGDPYVLVTVLHTKDHTCILTTGENPVIIPRIPIVGTRDDRVNVDA